MKKILVVLILTISLNLFAQGLLIDNEIVVTKYYNVLYPANFNPDEPDLQPDLFMLTITGVVPSNAELHCDMSWNGESVAYATLTPNTTGPFPTNPLFSSDIISNLPPTGFEIDQNFDDFMDDIEDLIIDTGRMPDGNYTFEIGIYENGHAGNVAYLITNQVTAILVIRSPISISLITPGNPIGLGVTNISEQYPNFIWFSNLEDYTIKIYELDEMYDTIEDIEMLEPHFVETGIAGTSYSYLPSAPEFEYNKTYAWQISATVESPIAASESEYKSTIYLFKLSDAASEELSLQILINFLNQLDIEGAEEVMSLLEAGYTLENLVWKGQEISAEDLMQILEEISSGEIEPTKITIE